MERLLCLALAHNSACCLLRLRLAWRSSSHLWRGFGGDRKGTGGMSRSIVLLKKSGHPISGLARPRTHTYTRRYRCLRLRAPLPTPKAFADSDQPQTPSHRRHPNEAGSISCDPAAACHNRPWPVPRGSRSAAAAGGKERRQSQRKGATRPAASLWASRSFSGFFTSSLRRRPLARKERAMFMSRLGLGWPWTRMDRVRHAVVGVCSR